MLEEEEAEVTSLEGGDVYRANQMSKMDLLVLGDLGDDSPPGEQYSVALVNEVCVMCIIEVGNHLK